MRRFLTITLVSIFLGLFLNFSFVFAALEVGEEEITGVPAPQCCKLKHAISGWGEVVGPKSKTTYIWVGAVSSTDPTKCIEPCPTDDTCKATPNWAGFCTLDAIASVGDIVKYVAMIAVGVALLVAAIMFIAAAGSPEKVKRAKAIFTYSLIGVLIATLAHFLPGVVRFFLGI